MKNLCRFWGVPVVIKTLWSLYEIKKPARQRAKFIAKLDRYADIAVALGENIDGLSDREAAERALTAIQTLSEDVGIPTNLTQLGVKKEDLKIMAENAQKDACGATNPRRPTLEDVIDIYTVAL